MMRQFELVEQVKSYDPTADEDALNRAYVYTMKQHGAQRRASGDPYFSHPIEVAGILTRYKLDTASIISALLHDTIEDTDATQAEIEKMFGPDVARLVDGVTKLSRIELQSDRSKQAENFRKLVLAMSEDIRVLLIKLADRLHNMRTLKYIASDEKRRRIALETMEIYAPLAERIGMSEIATDPQGANQNDIYISLRPRSAWRPLNGHKMSKAELGELIQSVIETNVPGQDLELNQPIAVRFDELLEGVRTDLAIKLFGPDYDELDPLAGRVADIVRKLPHAGEVVIDRPGRTAMQEFIPDPIPAVRFMIAGDVMNNAVSIGLAGREVGRVDEGDLFYPIVVRIAESARTNPATLAALPVRSADSSYVATLADVGKWQSQTSSVSVITREQARRREAIMVTVDSADVVGFVAQARAAIAAQVALPDDCRLEFSGAYKNWQSGSRRLAAAGGMFLLLSLALVYAALRNWRQTALVALGLPFALVGGVYGLWLRDLPLTMPAAIGFVTLGGLSLLNGMVLITYFNDLRAQGQAAAQAALNGAKTRLRPVLMTALVAGVGFVPMALSTSQGAELQRPFATVVIFGILTSTALTLVIIPLLLAGRNQEGGG